jgi:pSer/pThr/pTyr-binding forkhead associated (FHA) protein
MDVRVFIRPKSGNRTQEVLVPGQTSFVLGRGPTSAALLDGPGISRDHLAVSLEGTNILVTDLSVNGAWVNGKRLPTNEKYKMKPGEVVELPGYELQFQPVNSGAPSGKTQVNQEGSFDADPGAIPAPPPRKGIASFVGSFSFLEVVVIAAAVLSVALAAVYFMVS